MFNCSCSSAMIPAGAVDHLKLPRAPPLFCRLSSTDAALAQAATSVVSSDSIAGVSLSPSPCSLSALAAFPYGCCSPPQIPAAAPRCNSHRRASPNLPATQASQTTAVTPSRCPDRYGPSHTFVPLHAGCSFSRRQQLTGSITASQQLPQNRRPISLVFCVKEKIMK